MRDHDCNGDDESLIWRGRLAMVALAAAFVWPILWLFGMSFALPVAAKGFWTSVALIAGTGMQAVGLAGCACWLTRRPGLEEQHIAAVIGAILIGGSALVMALLLIVGLIDNAF